MTETDYVLAGNKARLVAVHSVLRDMITDEAGTWGVTDAHRSSIYNAVYAAMRAVRKKMGPLTEDGK
jgi:hypothetical protein